MMAEDIGHDLEYNLQSVLQKIADAAARAGRNPDDITLVAVSKTFPVETVLAAYSKGLRHFGENRVGESAVKIPRVNARVSGITWHGIGHLQSRKVKEAAELYDFVQSVDSAALARRLSGSALALGKRLPILLEVNISGETSKYGFSPMPREEFFAAANAILTLPNLEVRGLMTVAPIFAQEDDARPFFRALRELRDELRERFSTCTWQHLSMGMTDDFKAAIVEGATIVRIGRALFGERT
jgi:pyridoxal phosphate enzyme (YggS family)